LTSGALDRNKSGLYFHRPRLASQSCTTPGLIGIFIHHQHVRVSAAICGSNHVHLATGCANLLEEIVVLANFRPARALLDVIAKHSQDRDVVEEPLPSSLILLEPASLGDPEAKKVPGSRRP
jgi:hypothetical protein